LVLAGQVISARPEDELMDAAGFMLEEVGLLPVVENDRVVGIIIETDPLRQICRADAAPPACSEIIVSYR
jgi:predicted transcriptional regulator